MGVASLLRTDLPLELPQNEKAIEMGSSYPGTPSPQDLRLLNHPDRKSVIFL